MNGKLDLSQTKAENFYVNKSTFVRQSAQKLLQQNSVILLIIQSMTAQLPKLISTWFSEWRI